MMDTDVMIRQLRATAKKHENDVLHTFDTNVTALCTDVANRLEELYAENKEVRAKTIDEFAEVLKRRCSVSNSQCGMNYVTPNEIEEISIHLKGAL